MSEFDLKLDRHNMRPKITTSVGSRLEMLRSIRAGGEGRNRHAPGAGLSASDIGSNGQAFSGRGWMTNNNQDPKLRHNQWWGNFHGQLPRPRIEFQTSELKNLGSEAEGAAGWRLLSRASSHSQWLQRQIFFSRHLNW